MNPPPPNPPSAPLELMCRYLDGSLPPDDVARLNGQLKSNAALRTEFAELLLLDVQLSELGRDARATARSADGLVRTHQTDQVTETARLPHNLSDWGRSVRERASRVWRPAFRRSAGNGRISSELGSQSWRFPLALAASLALLLTLGVWFFGPTSGEPVVSAVAGVVRLERVGQANPTMASTGTRLYPGDMLLLGTNAAATIAFGEERTRFELGADTALKLTSLAGGKRFDLRSGRLVAQVARQRPFSPLVIATPNATATVLGTRFTVTASSNRTRLDVAEGTVRLADTVNTTNKPVKVSAGSYAVVAAATDLAALPQTGYVISEIWTNFNGQFEAIVDFLGPASRQTNWTRLESVSTEIGRRGERVRGFIHPPVTGNYVFSLSGGGNAKLLLSTNDHSTARTQIAYISSLPADRWASLSRHSAAVPLVAGRRYYFEIVHGAHAGAPPLRVGWKSTTRSDDIIPGEFISPHPSRP